MASYEGDTINAGYTEFLTKVKPSGKAVAARIFIVLAAAIVLFIMFYVTFKTIPVVSFMLAVAIIFLAWFCWQFTRVEYEYTVATGHVELSKIYGARVRKKVLSFETAAIERISPYEAGSSFKTQTLLACNANDPNAYRIVYTSANGPCAVVLSMPEKSIKCFRYYKRSAFTD